MVEIEFYIFFCFFGNKGKKDISTPVYKSDIFITTKVTLQIIFSF